MLGVHPHRMTRNTGRVQCVQTADLCNKVPRGPAMNAAYLSALSALAGSSIGALASLATTWLTHRYQDRNQRAAQEASRRERLFGEFIDSASELFAEALTHSLDDPGRLVPLYAILSKLRLFASKATIESADAVL